VNRFTTSGTWEPGGVHDRHQVLAGDVLEQRVQIDFLLVVGTQRHPLLLADDRHHRLMVELGVVQPVQQVHRAGARRGQAHANLAGHLRVRARRERGALLVAGLDELQLVADLVEGTQQAVDPVARVSVRPFDAPLGQAFKVN
jgi:hypothetical protein